MVNSFETEPKTQNRLKTKQKTNIFKRKKKPEPKQNID